MKKRKLRKSYQVMLEKGMQSLEIGWKGRLLSRRRADKVARFLRLRGHEVRVRFFGLIELPVGARCFD